MPPSDAPEHSQQRWEPVLRPRMRQREGGPLVRRDGDAVFDEAWQAQALAMADCLVRGELFSAGQWAEALGIAVREQEDTTEGYYRAVLAALERLLDQGPVPGAEVEARRDAWARAYEATPHGAPVELESAK